MAGFLRLAFDPHAWAAIGIVAVLAFSGGVVKGWSASNAEQWKQAAAAAKQAAADKEKLAEADRKRAEQAENEAARLDATLESYLHESKVSATACRLSPGDIDRLQRLAASGR